MDKIYNKILIVDGSYLLHRALKIPNMFELKNSKGDRTGGVFVFLRALNKEIMLCGDYFPIICFDSGLDKRRVSIDRTYKHADEREVNRNIVLTPEEAYNDYITQYRKQRNKLIELLSYFGIPSLKFQGVEGDDLMYFLSKISNDSIILTDDRDMQQLLSESCKVRRPMADEMWNINSFLEYKGYDKVYKFVVEKAVMGDGSDNIPGSCKGIGNKSVGEFIKLLYTFCLYDGDNIAVWDFSNYPITENGMREYCNKCNIKYKKAYLNFDRNRFLSNLGLVDLNLVSFDDSIQNSIVATINNCKSKVDYFKALKVISELEIKEFSVDDLIEKTNSRIRNLCM